MWFQKYVKFTLMFQKDIFESFKTKKQYEINHHFDCNDKCLIYLLSSKICGLKYVGSTTDRFRLMWNNCKDKDRKPQRGEEHMQLELFEHFHSEEHNGFLQDCSITLINRWFRPYKTGRILARGA